MGSWAGRATHWDCGAGGMWKDAKRLWGAAWCGTVWTHLEHHVRQNLEGLFQWSGSAGPLKFKVFVEFHQPSGLLAIPDPGGYLAEVMAFSFCVDKIFIVCLQCHHTSEMSLLCVGSLSILLYFSSPVNHIRHCSPLEM